MKELFATYAKRLDARSRRERMLILAAGIAVIVFPLYALVIAPTLQRGSALSAQIADQNNQIVVAQAQKMELERSLQQDPDYALREQLGAKRAQIARLDNQLSGIQNSLVPPQRMAALLQELIGQDRKVRIVRLHNLPATPLVEKSAAADSSATATSPHGESRHVFKHGVQVTVEGNYLDLVAYLARLEKQPWQVYWGRTALVADYPKVQVELTLYTLSLDQAWLVV
jgi:MSHA biogenesis protein MshJ